MEQSNDQEIEIDCIVVVGSIIGMMLSVQMRIVVDKHPNLFEEPTPYIVTKDHRRVNIPQGIEEDFVHELSGTIL